MYIYVFIIYFNQDFDSKHLRLTFKLKSIEGELAHEKEIN
jgi:hypothetical protein